MKLSRHLVQILQQPHPRPSRPQWHRINYTRRSQCEYGLNRRRLCTAALSPRQQHSDNGQSRLRPHGARASRILVPPPLLQQSYAGQSHRTLTSSPERSSHQSYTATRLLPYDPLALYKLIADVPSYSAFLPYCTASAVTTWSAADAYYGRQWPHTATLSVGYDPGILPGGFGGITESFSSRIYCSPPPPAADAASPEAGDGASVSSAGIVEAVIGNIEPSMDRAKRRHHEAVASCDDARREAQGPIEWLRTQWVVRPALRAVQSQQGLRDQRLAQTEVGFLLEYKFKNAAYEMLSSAVAPRIASHMIEVFERRARELLGPGPGSGSSSGPARPWN